MFESLIEQVDGNIEQIYADKAYDTRNTYDVASGQDAKLVAPLVKMQFLGKKATLVMMHWKA